MGAQWKAKGKALVADAKGKLFGKLVKEITVAARGGADPASNSRLRLVVEQARKASMPKDTLERAIKKGSGTGADAVSYERVIYEGFAPHQVAVMVECLTDNVNRTAPEMRVLFRKGQLGTSGSVAWDFNHVGIIEAERATADADPELAAIEAGAQDFEAGDEEGTTVFWTDPTDLDRTGRCRPLLDLRRVGDEGPSLPAWRRVRCGGGPGRHHPCRRFRRCGGRPHHRPAQRCGRFVGRARSQASAGGR